MTSLGRPPRLPFAGASDTLLPVSGVGLTGRPRGDGDAGWRCTDQLAEAGQSAAAYNAVRRTAPPRPHERTRYPGRGQGSAHSGPGLLVGDPEAEGVALALAG